MAKVRVLIAESTDITRVGLVGILKGDQSFEIAGTVKSAPEAEKAYKSAKPDICLVSDTLNELDIGIFMQHLLDTDKHARVVMLTDNTDISQLNCALKAGVVGYLLKSIGTEELRNSILNASRGKKVFSQSFNSLMSDRYADLTQSNSDSNPMDQITKRETEVLQLIVDGYTSQEIAKLLYISPRTVETHRSNLMQKLKIKNTAALVRFALEEGSFTRTL
jgi:DNA-binding NarL/FixJ family response regulator